MSNKWHPPEGTKITMPSIRVTAENFKYQRGADVQATWRKYGWMPPSLHLPPPPPEKPSDLPFIKPLRAIK
jgi:hypothetical protein